MKISPHKLYEMAKGNDQEYKRLLIQEGHLMINHKEMIDNANQAAREVSLKENDLKGLINIAYHGIRACRSYTPINEKHLERAEDASRIALDLIDKTNECNAELIEALRDALCKLGDLPENDDHLKDVIGKGWDIINKIEGKN